METPAVRRSVRDTRERILDVALVVLGQNPDAGMSEIAAGAGVVRRTVYGHFPSRDDLVRTLAQRAAEEVVAVLCGAAAPDGPADEVWVDFIARLWPLVHRYRVLVVLRRGAHGAEIHDLLGPVETVLADLVERGQESGVFGRHLPAGVLGRVAWSTVFTLADSEVAERESGARAVTITSLLILGVPAGRAEALLDGGP